MIDVLADSVKIEISSGPSFATIIRSLAIDQIISHHWSSVELYDRKRKGSSEMGTCV